MVPFFSAAHCWITDEKRVNERRRNYASPPSKAVRVPAIRCRAWKTPAIGREQACWPPVIPLSINAEVNQKGRYGSLPGPTSLCTVTQTSWPSARSAGAILGPALGGIRGRARTTPPDPAPGGCECRKLRPRRSVGTDPQRTPSGRITVRAASLCHVDHFAVQGWRPRTKRRPRRTTYRHHDAEGRLICCLAPAASRWLSTDAHRKHKPSAARLCRLLFRSNDLVPGR
jgi:hypothetical protein